MNTGLHVSVPSTTFTCNTCGIKFIAADLQREHMKTSWHRYNLKRRVTGLPSVTSDVFAHKVLHQQKLASLKNEVDEFGFELPKSKAKNVKKSGQRGRLPIIDKLSNEDIDVSDRERSVSPAKSEASEFSQFSLGDTVSLPEDYESNFDTGSELNYSELDDEEDIELNSEEEKLLETEEETDDEFIEVLPITFCFYCKEQHNDIESNLKHMFNKHGLYIPERTYLIDLEGLLTFLSEIIYIDNECFVCGFEGRNLESIRQHMTSKGHCKIPFETFEERETIEEFYDFNVEETPKDDTTKKPSTKSNKLVAFNENLISAPKNVKLENDRKVLSTGLEIGHKDDMKYHHKPASSILKHNDSQKSVILSDRRLAPGLTMRTVTKQEKLVRRFEHKQRSKKLNHHNVGRENHKEHFFDPNTFGYSN
ncbi:cytoplasmic 60S subunit biogenesis factor Reh1p [[Candida] jaroonii]|uniref:Cytoplasmic 60S subunit biogenesis factor Reh1p n=1 Tax=[Candida] jaroonii TaxID=467808 RepID=A0ACA9Y994_9ASCO|nr:cytoplasmic 60S subunit biogenesis factor Reh1p [[Candida] jaroonii]